MAPVRRAIHLEDEIGLQVARVVVSRIEVGDDPRRDAEAPKDCRNITGLVLTLTSCSNLRLHVLNKTQHLVAQPRRGV